MSKNRDDVQDMTPEKAKELKTYVQAIAALLYEETPLEKLNTLEEIEQTVRQKVIKHLFVQKLGFFYPSRHRDYHWQNQKIKKQHWPAKTDKKPGSKIRGEIKHAIESTSGKVLFTIECKCILCR